MQYTLRNIPDVLDAALRERAKVENQSLNEVALKALARGLGFADRPVRLRDLRDLAGSWRGDAAFEEAIADQHGVDDELWK